MKTKFNQSKESIILLDFSNQVWRNHHATEHKMAPNSDGVHIGSILGLSKVLMHSINRAKEYNSLPKLVICEDRVPTRKRDLYVKFQDAFKDYKTKDNSPILYKGNRAKKDLDYNPIDICQMFMSCIPHTRIWCENEEADDVLASFIHNNKQHKIFLYSSDRDMWQLLNEYPNLTIFFDSDGSYPTDEYMNKKFNTTDFNKVSLHKILRGDSGDNVKSIRNYQFKRSIDAWNECGTSIESYLNKLVKIYGKNNTFIQQLLKPHNIKLLILNRELVKLKTKLNYKIKVFKKPKPHKWKNLCYTFETPSLLRTKLMEVF